MYIQIEKFELTSFYSKLLPKRENVLWRGISMWPIAMQALLIYPKVRSCFKAINELSICQE